MDRLEKFREVAEKVAGKKIKVKREEPQYIV